MKANLKTKLARLKKEALEAENRLAAVRHEITYRKLTREKQLTVKKFVEITCIAEERILVEFLLIGYKKSIGEL